MQWHIRLLSILFYLLGALGLAVALVVLLIGMGSIMAIVHHEDGGTEAAATVATGCTMMVVLLFVVPSIPNILAGWGLSRGKAWARIFTIVLAIINLPLFPFGTGLGVYALWVMFNDEAKRLLDA